MLLLDIFIFVLIGICGVTDLQTGKIYNKITYPAIVAGFLWNAVATNAPGLKSSLQGFLIAALLMGTLTLLGGMGGGDTKLIAAIGAIKGYPFIVDVLFYSFLVGGAIALSVAVWQGRFFGTMRRVGQMLFGVVFYRTGLVVGVEENQSYKIPFGVAICLGTLWAQLVQILSS